MADRIVFSKIVSSLPGVLVGNTLYAVRTGAGFDLYLTSDPGLGTVVAKKVNDTDLSSCATLTGTETLTNKTLTSPKINVGSDATNDMYTRNSSGIYTRIAGPTASNQLLTSNTANPTTVAPSWQAGSPEMTYLSTVLNMTATSTTACFTSDANRGIFIPWTMKYIVLSKTGATASPGTINFGFTSAAYSDIVNSFNVITATSVNNWVPIPLTLGASIAANTQLFTRITTAITASAFTILILFQGVYTG